MFNMNINAARLADAIGDRAVQYYFVKPYTDPNGEVHGEFIFRRGDKVATVMVPNTTGEFVYYGYESDLATGLWWDTLREAASEVEDNLSFP
jgi:hypothetical protein